MKRKRAGIDRVPRRPDLTDRLALGALIAFTDAADAAVVVRSETRERFTEIATGRVILEHVAAPRMTAADRLALALGDAGFRDAAESFKHLSRADQQLAHASLWSLLNQIAAGGFVAWHPPADQDTASAFAIGMVASPGVGSERRLRRQGEFKGPAVFWMSVIELVERAAPLLRRCPECQSLFAKQKGQKYCAPPKKCSQRTRSAKWYAAHKRQVLRRRHQDYVAQVKKRHPHAVVRRRPRLKRAERK